MTASALALTTRVERTLAVIKNFRHIIEQENEALDAFDFQRATQISVEKKRASELYAEAIENLIPFASELKTLPDTLKKALRDEREIFDAACDHNKAALKRGAQMAQRLSNRIVTIAKKALHEDGVNYNRYGTSNQTYKRPVYMQVNETL